MDEINKVATVIFTKETSSTYFLSPDIQEDGTGFYIEVANEIAADFEYVLGIEYEMKVELPKIFYRIERQVDRVYVPVVSNIYLALDYSGKYDVEIERLGYDDIELEITPLTTDVYPANGPAIVEFSAKPIPVYCKGDQLTVIIKSTDPLPASISSYSWDGHYHTRGISYA